MKKLSIVTVPDPSLKKPTQKVSLFDQALKEQINDMVGTLRQQIGVGLAANQVGIDNRVVVIECADDDRGKIPLSVFVNPEIVQYSDEINSTEEGCFSVPKIELDIERANKIKVKYQDESGKSTKFTPKGFLARILQHEIDHLNGIIFTERAKEQMFRHYPELKHINILFCGSGEFAAIILECLMLLGLNVKIMTEKEKPAGRNLETKKTAVAQLAQKFGVKFWEVEKMDALPKELTDTSLDLLICADFGRKIPQEILELPNLMAINIHPSLLPKYQGPTPIPSAILAGETETGTTIIRMEPEIDKGPILAQASVDLGLDENSLDLEERLATVSLKLLIKALPLIVKKEIRETNQDQTKATQTRKFTKEDGLIDWKKPQKKIIRQINAFFPWPGTYTLIDGKRLIIHQAHLEDTKLAIDIVQPEGKRPMAWPDFLRGYHGPKPEWFSKIS